MLKRNIIPSVSDYLKISTIWRSLSMLNVLFEVLLAFLLFKKGKTGSGIVIAFTLIVIAFAVVAIVTQSDFSR